MLQYGKGASVSAGCLLLAFLHLGVLSDGLRAQTYLYALNLDGKVTVNGSELESLGGDFDDDPIQRTDEAWADLVVERGDRYVLRRDGRVKKNNEKIADLPYSVSFPFRWISLAVKNGTFYSLRQDGVVARGKDLSDALPTAGFLFRKLVIADSAVYVLRIDGAVFRLGNDSPVFKFTAGRGVFGFGDGLEQDTLWISMAFNENDGKLYALRSDGHIYSGELPSGDEDGEIVNALPFPGLSPIFVGDLYVDLAFTSNGSWKVLRADGELYSDISVLSPLVDLPGNASEDGEVYSHLATFGTDFWSLRTDGRVYQNLDTEEILRLPGDIYNRIDVSDSEPTLGNFKNMKPVAAQYKTSTVVGTPLAIPVIVTDTDKASEELLVSPGEPLPPGSVWDAETRTLVWDDPGPKGSYKFPFVVDDGVNQPKQFKHTIKIKDPDEKVDKNKKPLLAKIKKAQPLVGFEFVLPIIVDDEDGDDVIITVDTTAYPFNSGASFNPATSSFIWTPEVEDQGKVTVEFFVSDTTTTKVLKVKLDVENPLIF